MRLPVRLVGSANVAKSFGSGTSGSGLCVTSNLTSGPSPGGVFLNPDGAVSTSHAAAMRASAAIDERAQGQRRVVEASASFFSIA